MIRKYIYGIPTLLTTMYVVFLIMCGIYNFELNMGLFMFTTILCACPILAHIVQTIKSIIHAFNNDKKLWVLLLVFFNILLVPYYGNKYIMKKIILKNNIITYLVALVFLSALVVLLTLTKVGKNTEKIFTTRDDKVEFKINTLWEEKKTDGYSLYAECNKKKLSIGVLTFDMTGEYFENYTALNILEDQTNYLNSQLEIFELYKDKKTRHIKDKEITTIEYKGKGYNDKQTKIYKLSVVEFDNKENYVLYVFETVNAKKYKISNGELNKILDNIKLK